MKNSPPFLGAILSSIVTAFAGIGDTVLYVILPVYYTEMGISLTWVGFLLSINRIIRISSNIWISNLILHIGLKRMILIAAGTASISTIAYGSNSGILIFALARIIWGIAYSGLKTATLFYASKVEKHQGMAFGLFQGIKSSGGILALIIGPGLVLSLGIKTGLYSLALLSAFGFVLGLLLPNVPMKNLTQVKIRKTFSFSPINLLVGIFAVAVDGILVVSLAYLFSHPSITSAELLSIVAFYSLLKKILVSGVSVMVGIFSIRIDPYTVFITAIILCIFSFVLIALNFMVSGIILSFCSNSVIVSFAPMVAIHQNGNNHLQQLSGVTTWWDLGAGTGAFIGISCLTNIGSFNLFLILGALSTILFINFISRNETSNRRPL